MIVRDLERRFGPRVALAGVSLEVQPGSITCLAGPNGSGKSTLLKILAGLLRPTSGEARVLGCEPFANRERVARAGARFVFAPPALYDQLSARDQALALARMSDPRVEPRAVDAALERVGLGDRANDRVRGYSFGMRQRLALAQALVPRPRLLVLDEPTEGLDPLAVLELRGVLRELANGGVTVLLASHLLVELEELGDHLLVLDGGEELYQGPPTGLLAGRSRTVIEVDDRERGQALLAAAGWSCESEGGRLLLEAPGLGLERCQGILAAEGLRLLGFRREELSLEKALLARLREHRGAGDDADGGTAR